MDDLSIFGLDGEEGGTVPRECRIWRAVILQMVLDIKSQSPKPKMKKNKLEALEWFKLENEDFKTVCSLAGYDPEWIEKCFKNAQKRGFQWRKSSKTLLNITFPNIMNYKKGQQIDLFIVLQ